jgi:tetratricopeptide (TPR) repeat protein
MVASGAEDESSGESKPSVIEHLGGEERRTLAYASAIGREFDFPLLVAAMGLEEEALAEQVERLTHLGILRESVGGDRFSFMREESRTAIYQSLTASRLRVIHRKIADAMEKLYPTPPPEIVPELGRHYFLGRETEKSFRYNRRAAELAITDDTPEVAAHHLERARIDLHTLSGDRTVEEAELAMQLGDLYYGMGDVRGADRLYGEALEFAGPERPALRARILLARAEVARDGLRAEDAQRSARAARELFEGASDESGVAEVHRILGRVAYHKGAYREALDEALTAREILERVGQPRRLGRVAIDLGNAFRALQPESGHEALVWYDRAIGLLTEAGEWTEVARAYIHRALLVGEQNPIEALEDLAKGREFAERSHEPRFVSWALLSGVEFRLALGQVEEAERDNQLAGRLIERTDEPLGCLKVGMNYGLIAERRGRWEEASTAYQDAVDAGRRLKVPPEQAEAEFRLASLLFKTRDLVHAREHFDASENLGLPRLRPPLAPTFRDLGRQLGATVHESDHSPSDRRSLPAKDAG